MVHRVGRSKRLRAGTVRRADAAVRSTAPADILLESSPDASSPRRPLGERSSRWRWFGLVLLCSGQLMLVLDVTIVNVALPTIQRQLGFSAPSLSWVVNAYLATLGGLMLLCGRLGDLLGRKRIFTAGLALFTLASLACGLAGSGTMLIAARFVQGVGAALLSSMTLGILVTMFPERREQATAMSVFSFVAVAGGSIGLLAGGLITQGLGWHWIFFVNVPIGVLLLALTPALIPRHRGLGMRRGVDVPGALLVVAIPLSLIYAIVEAGARGWGSRSSSVFFAVAFALTVAFAVLERRQRAPLIPLRIFRSRALKGANGARTLFGVGRVGSYFVGALLLQRLLHYSALETGVAFLPQTLSNGVISLLVPRIARRLGDRLTLVLGLLVTTAGLALFARVPAPASYVADLLAPMLLLGIGSGLTFMPSATLAMVDADPSDSGLASGIASVSFQFGSAIGVAVVATVAADRASQLLRSGTAAAVALLDGYHLAFLVAGASVLAGAVLATSVLERRDASEEAPEPRQ